jgi:hypothetical protein
MLGNNKNVFWEALLIAGAIFILGLLLGVFVESGRLNEINNYYAKAEVSLIDSLALSNTPNSGMNCNNIISTNIQFAESIYNEALLLEKYEDSGKITDDMITAHQRYDLLRTILWQNLMKIRQKCPDSFNSVVYLYEYNSPDIEQKAVQNVWSNILYDVKQKEGNKIILVPIAVNSNLSSLNYMTKEFNITDFPAVIINDKIVLYSLESSLSMEKYLS